MKEDKKEFVTWVKAHKTELIIAGVSIGAILAIILGIKNRDSLVKVWNTMRAAIKTEHAPTKQILCIQATEAEEIINAPFEVSGHVRNLHPGCHASAEKLAEAKAMGIILLPGQTLVDAYTKRGAAA